MIGIQRGEFRMGDIQGSGSADEQPVHSVRIPRPFAMGRYEITFDEYDVFARLTGRALLPDQGWGRGRRPVINVSWDDAVAYTKWLSEQTGKRYRLPTEAEWEYAARAGTEMIYWWGDEVGEKNRANCDGCGSRWDNKQTAPVGSFASNPWGLYDWWATCGSGCRTATTKTTRVRRRTAARRGRRAAIATCACAVAVPGSADRCTCARRTGTGTSQTTGTTTLVFVSPRTSISPFLFILLPFYSVIMGQRATSSWSILLAPSPSGRG
jgi:hypothetical protein